MNHGRTIVGVTPVVLHALQTLKGAAHLSTGWRGPLWLVQVASLVLREGQALDSLILATWVLRRHIAVHTSMPMWHSTSPLV